VPLSLLGTTTGRSLAARASDALFLRACRRETVERTPAWIMRQAGRYLPEYRALRERHDFLTFCRTPELAAELTLQPIRRYPLDAAILFSDILIPLPGMGVEVAFEPGPKLERTTRTRSAILELRTPDAREAAPYVGEAVRLVQRELGGRVPLIGFAGAPFTLASYLVEGGGSKNFEHTKALFYDDPETADLLLGKCADAVASSLRAQLEAGVDAVMLFDSWAGILPPAAVRRFALPFARRAFENALAAVGYEVPRIYYAGQAAGWLEDARDSGAQVVGVDWRVDLDEAQRRLGPDVVVQGNLDPCVLLAPLDEVRRRAQALVRSADPRLGHVFNLGHGILPGTPPEAVAVLLDAVREASQRRVP
jgi:uroporphyrinogen decarboxylase